MNITHTHQGKDYHLTNENLEVGDETFPISNGRVTGDTYKHEYFNFNPVCCGFPDEPHIIVDLKHSDSKAYQIRTQRGYGPAEEYFKIVEHA